jgi:hypothetical protein
MSTNNPRKQKSNRAWQKAGQAALIPPRLVLEAGLRGARL